MTETIKAPQVKVIAVPGKGNIAFPGDMSDEQIASAIKANIEPADQPLYKAAGRGVLASVGSLVKAGSGIAEAAFHPVQTLTGLANIGEGAIAKVPGGKALLKAGGESPEEIAFAEHSAEALGQDYKNAYGSWPRIKETLATDPFRFAADLSASLGLAGKAATASKAQKAGQVLSKMSEVTNPVQVVTKPVEKAAPLAGESEAEALARKSANATRDVTIAESQKAGYTIPRSAYDPSATTNILESISGKAATLQEAAKRNQAVTNSLARKYLKLPENIAFSEDVMSGLVSKHSKIYDEARKLPAGVVGEETTQATMGAVKKPLIKSGDELVDEIRKARKQARDNYAHYERTADPKAQEIAEAAVAKAEELEGQLDILASKNFKPDTLNELRKSRKELAKIHSIENAMNTATGEINALSLKSQLDKGVPLTDEAKTIANFAKGFQNIAKPASSVPAPSVSATKALASLGAGLMDSTGGLMTAAAVYGGPAVARKAALSKALQIAPEYKPSMVRKLMEKSGKANPLALALYELNNAAQQGEQ